MPYLTTDSTLVPFPHFVLLWFFYMRFCIHAAQNSTFRENGNKEECKEV